MQSNVTLGIVEICKCLEQNTSLIYSEFAKQTKRLELSSFWSEVAEEELEHATFWENIGRMAADGLVPQIFERPLETKDELQKLAFKIQKIRETPLNQQFSPFLTALKLEYHLLHSAFAAACHFAKKFKRQRTPGDDYHHHLQQFGLAAKYFKMHCSELSLIEEMLLTLWSQSQRMAIQSNTDLLTGVLSRRELLQVIAASAQLAYRENDDVGILLIDIDNFKSLNNYYGPEFGDEIIKAVAESIQSRIRASDILGRYSGEEFLVFFPKVNTEFIKKPAQDIGTRVRNMVPDLVSFSLHHPITVSIAIVHGKICKAPEVLIPEMIKRAEELITDYSRQGKTDYIVELEGSDIDDIQEPFEMVSGISAFNL